MSRPPRETRPNASPVCYAEQISSDAEGLLSNEAVIRELNALIEGERAGARGLLDMRRGERDRDIATVLDEVARDEARFCAMLAHHVERRGGEPSLATGVFRNKLLARRTLGERLDLLDRGQKAVVRTLERILPLLDDAALAGDLEEMRTVHLANIDRCAAFLNSAPERKSGAPRQEG
jgi:hypothetical protein